MRILILVFTALLCAPSVQAAPVAVQVRGDLSGDPFVLDYVADADLGVVSAMGIEVPATTYTGAIIGTPILQIGQQSSVLDNVRFSIVNGRDPESVSTRTLDQFGFTATTMDGSEFIFMLVSTIADTVTSTDLFVAPRLADFELGLASLSKDGTIRTGVVTGISASAVPEPDAAGLLGMGLLAGVLSSRWRARRDASTATSW
jgi:hypothetical protein